MDTQLERRTPWLAGRDHSTSGAHFVTVCTRGKEKVLGEVVGGGIYDAPQVRLSVQGKAVEESLRQMSQHETIRVEKAVIMPNHIHLLLFVREHGGSS